MSWTVTQIRRLLEAGLSTEDIGLLLPCAVGVAPDLDPCPELLATLRARFRGLDEHIGTLTRSRQTLRRYLEATDPAWRPVTASQRAIPLIDRQSGSRTDLG